MTNSSSVLPAVPDQAPAPSPRRPARRRARNRLGPPWLFVLPAVLVYGAIVLYPSVSGIIYAFTD